MYINLKAPSANWVIDDIANDYKNLTRHTITNNSDEIDLMWCIDLFSFRNVFRERCKKVLSIHHVNQDRISEYDFKLYNNADACIVPNDITLKVAQSKLTIPVYKIPYWVMSKYTNDKNISKVNNLLSELRKNDEILIGSFVKDGNGTKGDGPKLSKGPDILINVLSELKKMYNIKVVLAGYARNYVIKALEKENIPYVYYERYDDLSSLYDCVDWYFVTSRFEGGPQSILETSHRKVKILSRNVGLASEVLHSDCICNDVSDFIDRFKNGCDRVDYNYESVQNYRANNIIPIIDNLFEEIGSWI